MGGGEFNGREGGPSISRSSAWAMSIRLSPAETSNVCSEPSLSMKVTCSLEDRDQLPGSVLFSLG